MLRTGGEDRIKVRGIDDLMVFRARCCNPIRGEKIVGYITRGKGVSVHSATCPNVVNLLYDPERRIDVEWDKAVDESRYTVRLTMQVEDRKGILADVSAKVADINTNITNVEATTDEDRRGRIDMTVEISDMKHLEKVIKSLRGVNGVIDVEQRRADGTRRTESEVVAGRCVVGSRRWSCGPRTRRLARVAPRRDRGRHVELRLGLRAA